MHPAEVYRSYLTPLRFLQRSADVFREKTAIIHADQRFSYPEFAERAYRLANGLKGLGVKKGDRIAALLPNIPPMLEAGGGSVINIASFVAVMGAAVSQGSYTASKGAVLALSRELGVEFAARGIRVNALCPGPVSTPLLQELFAKDPERAAKRLVHVPMGRFGEPEEIAKSALFLASDDSSFVTASTFLVDGGLSNAYLTPGQV